MSAPAQRPASSEWLTIPNAITLARLLLIVPVCWLLIQAPIGSWWPVILMAVWASTDWIDGFLARKLGQSTRAGEILDPVADRLGSVAIVLSLAITGVVPWWVIAVIAAVDIVVLIVAGPAALRGDIHVTQFGKVRTAVMFLAIVVLVFAATLVPAITSIGQWVLWLGTAMHVVAGIDYIVRVLRRRTRAATSDDL